MQRSALRIAGRSAHWSVAWTPRPRGLPGREVSAPPPSKRQLAFLDRASRQFTTDPGTAGICLIEVG